jgi:hypothetical protein
MSLINAKEEFLESTKGKSDTLDTSTETPDNFQWVPLIPASLHKTIEEELTRLNSGPCCLLDSLIMNQKDYEEAIEFFGHLTSEEQKVQNNYVVSLGRGTNRKLK